jgi:RNA polymerase sigma factor (sigma-70 family)
MAGRSMTTARTDADIICALRDGDRNALAELYDRYADRLYDFCRSVLRDDAEAADVTQDTFLYAVEHADALRDPSKVRAWLYAIARHACFKRQKKRRQHVGDDVLDRVASSSATPDEVVEDDELAALVWSAADGLTTRDRALLDLHLRQGLVGAELADAIGESPSHTNVLLSRVRDHVERSIGALLVARVGRKDCDELAGILNGWDGKLTPLLRKRLARHVDDCDICGARRKVLVNPLALFGAAPAMAAPVALRDRVLDRASSPVPHKSRRPRALHHLERTRRWIPFVIGALVALVAVTMLGATVAAGGSSRKRVVTRAAAAPDITTSPTTVRRSTSPRTTVTVPGPATATSIATTIVGTRIAPAPGLPAPGGQPSGGGTPVVPQGGGSPPPPPTTVHVIPPVSLSFGGSGLSIHSGAFLDINVIVHGGAPGATATIGASLSGPYAYEFNIHANSCTGAIGTGNQCTITLLLDATTIDPDANLTITMNAGAVTKSYTLHIIGIYH